MKAIPVLSLIWSLLITGLVSAETVRIHLVWTNDIHGHVAPEGARFMNPNFPPPLGGGASAAGYMQRLRASVEGKDNEFVLLVDAGDTWQGDPVGTATEGRVMETYFDVMDYDVVVPGNHEFDKGKEVAIRMSLSMKKKFVCANMYDSETGEILEWVEPYRIIERGGLRIGIIGANTPGTKNMAFTEHIAGIDFGPIVPAVEKYRDILKNEKNVDLVFLAVHEGLPFDPEATWKELMEREAQGENLHETARSAMELAHVIDGVPVIVAGHTHRGYEDPWIDPVTHTIVLETYGNGSSLGHVILNVDRETNQIIGHEQPLRRGVLVTMFEDEWWPEGEMREALQPYIEEVSKGLEVKVGESHVVLTRSGGGNSPMGNFVTDAMRAAFDADLAFTNTGGLRTDLSAGKISVGDVRRVLPFGNTLVVIDMDGNLVRRIFERKMNRRAGLAQSGAQVVYDPEQPEGQRVLELLIGGQPIQPNKLYKVVTSNYLMEGNSGLDFLAHIPEDQVNDTRLLIRDAVIRYLEKNSPISPKRDDRMIQRSGQQPADYIKRWDAS